MMKSIVAAVTVLVAGCSSTTVVQPVFDSPVLAYPLSPAILENRNVSDGFASLVARSGYGRSAYESAAFLVMDDANNWRLVPWPATNLFHAQRWKGAVPRGTVAIVHTHPAHLPDASRHDMDEARRTGIPIFVLTPGTVVLVGGRDGQQLFAANISG